MWKGRELDELCTMEQLDEIIHSIEAAAQDDKTKQADKKRRWQREKPDGVAIDMKKRKFHTHRIQSTIRGMARLQEKGRRNGQGAM